MVLTMEMCSDALMLYSLRLSKGHVQLFFFPHTFPSLEPSAPTLLALIDPTMSPSPKCHIFFFDTATLSLLLGIPDWKSMHHRRSISSDRNAAPWLGEMEG